MRLGVDFGTTRIVVAAVDRGNYPVVTFDSPEGEAWEGFPSLVAARGAEALYGFDAWRAQEFADVTIVRSIKRFLMDAGPETQVNIGGATFRMLDLLCGLTAAFRAALQEASSLSVKADEPLEIMLGVPANANGNQRFLTVEAFRRSGFSVIGLLNEPSSASIEYGHAIRAKQAATKDSMIVYDLGGGTFDASLVEMDAQRHEVLASEGIPTLGGDDFDEMLAELALEAAGLEAHARESLTQSEVFRLHEECRRKKEGLHPNTKRVTIDLDSVREGWPSVQVPVADFYGRCQSMIDETVHAVEDLLRGREASVEGVYVTGGSSELPMVSRALKEKFGRRVKRTSYPRSATAIGLAIQADSTAGYQLREKFTRSFGVWREAEGGRTMVFDPLFLKGTPLPAAGEPPLQVTRSYYPAHNIGHFRYLECSHTSEDGRPAGEVMVWDQILFPFDEALSGVEDLSASPVARLEWAPPREIREEYSCDASGAVSVKISNVTSGYSRDYRLGRWAVQQAPLVPGRKRRATKAARTS
jgi:molecular chaperone DnaK (HSP70)